MENINIVINKETRMIQEISKRILGNDGENLQENLIFSFDDEFVNGTARLELIMPDDTTSYLMLTKVQETYQIPVRSVMTKEGKINMQLVITEGTDEEEIPIFKSNVFFVRVNTSINAETIAEEDYPEFIDVAETKLNAMDIALGEVDNLDITASKSGTTATITITDKEGNETSVEINDGIDGQDGQDGITPTIGDNGDWYLGNTDTGKPSRGETGPVGPAGAIRLLIVNELPSTGAEGTLYFVPKQDTETSDIYDEYMWVNNAWELLGEKQITVDLSDYYTKTETNTLLDGKVSPTDYATGSVGGVIITDNGYGTQVVNGKLISNKKTYAQYETAPDNMFTSKGTLENVITGKQLVNQTYVDNLVGDISSAIDSINGENV